MNDLPPFPITEERAPTAESPGDLKSPARINPKADIPILLVEGREYAGWLELRATRGLERCAADFDIGLVERWPGQATAWPLGPFTPLQLLLGDEPVITGYVDVWSPSLEAARTALRVSGRSRTADLIDCCPVEGTGEFRASTLEAVARAFADPYGIAVENLANLTDPVALLAYKRSETCFSILEKQARQQGVLLSDGAAGQLLITRGPALDAAPVAELVEGKNILTAKLKLDVSNRFQKYETRTQGPVAAAVSLNPVGDRPAIPGFPPPADRRPQQPATRTVTGAAGVVTDPDVPRTRLKVMEGESAGNGVSAEARATWECAAAAGKSVRLSIELVGWRRPDGVLWGAGDTVMVVLPSMRLKRRMAVVTVSWSMSNQGRIAVLDLAPPEGLQPEPLAPAPSGGRAAPVALNRVTSAPIEGLSR